MDLSFGSYSSMCLAPIHMDITSQGFGAHDATCAFPSWPRRESLSESDNEGRPSSFLSDDDLFWSDTYDDDTRSASSFSSIGSANGFISPPHAITDAEYLEMERERLALQREFVRAVVSEKERRRAARRKKSSSKGKKSSSNDKKPKNNLSTIAE